MNDRQRKFAQLVAQGKSGREAYEEVYSARGAAADSCATKLLRNTEVEAYLKELRAESHSKAVMSLQERKEWLSDVVRTPLSEIDHESSLCVEHTEDQIGGGAQGQLKRGDPPSGNETVSPLITRVKIKKADPLRAMDLLNKLEGDYAPEKVEHTVTSVKDIIAKARSGGS